MGASYFEFKQFRVDQDCCAMKVCTDSCLFGAMTAAHFKNQLNAQSTILDIGGGAGLLSLMLAQQIKAAIHTVEIDADAYRQMKQNLEDSVFKNRVQAHHAAIQRWESQLKFDLIISNPPFLKNSLRSPDTARNSAMHQKDLTLEELAFQINRRLKGEGAASLLLPFERANEMCSYMQEFQLYCYQKTDIRKCSNQSFFRSVLFFSRERQMKMENKEMAIRVADGSYSNLRTPDFSQN